MIPLQRSHTMPKRYVWLVSALSVLAVVVVAGWLVVHSHPSSRRDVELSQELTEWQAFGGSWVSKDDSISNLRNGRGDKLVSNRATPPDFLVTGDLRFDSETDMKWGDAGLIVRATDISNGTDSFNGYYVGLRPVSRELLLGREEFDYINLAVRPLSEPLELGAWYRLQLIAKGCHLEARAFNKQGDQIGDAVADEKDCHLSQGAVGLRSYSMLASWRHLAVRSPL